MTSVRHQVFRAAFAALSAIGAPRWAGPAMRGLGAILMLHHVRPWVERAFAPPQNRLLEVTPECLDQALTLAAQAGYRFVGLDEIPSVLEAGRTEQPVLALTFDDGYRDNLEFALPVLRRHRAPATVFITTGFADRSACLWWIDLENVIRNASSIRAQVGAETITAPAATPVEKVAAFELLYWKLRARPEAELRAVIANLRQEYGVDSRGAVERLCLDWDGVRQLAEDPLVTIGAHTLTHPMLRQHDTDFARREMAAARDAIQREIGRPVRHMAYPVGDKTSAGPREFRLARELGFRTAVTTRPGMLFPQHGAHLTALPRVSLNGLFQERAQLEALLSGIPFWLWNRGRLLNVD